MSEAEPGGGEPSVSDRGAGPRYRREGDGLEFDRVSFFCDAVYAIALTLMAVELRPPGVADSEDPSELLHALGEMFGEIWLFFVVVLVIGSYWVAHHRFVAGLRAVSSRFVFATIPYLAFIAFLPFPANLMGTYGDNPVAGSLFAISMGFVSFGEWVLLQIAHRDGLFREEPSAAVFRSQSIGSLTPVLLFLVSIPLMFVDPLLGIAFWFVNVPVGILLNRLTPRDDAREAGAS